MIGVCDLSSGPSSNSSFRTGTAFTSALSFMPWPRVKIPDGVMADGSRMSSAIESKPRPVAWGGSRDVDGTELGVLRWWQVGLLLASNVWWHELLPGTSIVGLHVCCCDGRILDELVIHGIVLCVFEQLVDVDDDEDDVVVAADVVFFVMLA